MSALALGTLETGVPGAEFAAIALAAAALEPIALDGVGKAALLDRLDTKFILPAARLPLVLESCAPGYRVLEVGGARLRAYRTRYFDTPDLAFYHAHHAGRLPRYKVRVRSYLETGQHFLEVKLKTNKRRMLKSRLPLEDERADPVELLCRAPLLGIAGAVTPAVLRPVVSIGYTRITLVGRGAAERVTLDLLLGVRTELRALDFPDIVIAEVKQEQQGPSQYLELMRRLGQRQIRVSKYCLGVASLVEHARKNRFKPLLHHIQRTSGNHVQPGTR